MRMAETRESFLAEIVAARRRRVEEARARVPLETLKQAAAGRSERRNFIGALAGGEATFYPSGVRVIAELKRASPSRGLLRRNYRRRDIAQAFESAGAAALSVLTEEEFFLGSLNDLREVRSAVGLPVLRKDFILDKYQVYESVAADADAVLLIVAALPDEELGSLIELCRRFRLPALVEVHAEEELDRAVGAEAEIIGVNNRDLETMEVNLETSLRLRSKIPSRCLAVSESGVRTAADLRRLSNAGYNAVLVGEHLLTSPQPGRELAQLLDGARSLASPHV